MQANTDDIVFRTVRMRSNDAEKFRNAFQWLMETAGEVDGLHSAAVYRAADDSEDVLIIEIWESTDAMARSYERMGEAPFEFVARAGSPEMLEDRFWHNAILTSAKAS